MSVKAVPQAPISKLVVSNRWANSTVKKVGLTLLHQSYGICKPRMLNQFTISTKNSHGDSDSDTNIANHGVEQDQIS